MHAIFGETSNDQGFALDFDFAWEQKQRRKDNRIL